MELPKSKSPDAFERFKEDRSKVYKANKNKVVEHLQKRGLRKEAIAAMLANIDVETGGSFDFTQKQTVSGRAGDPETVKGGGVGLFQFDDYQKGVGNESWYKEYLEDSGKKDSTESQIDYVLDAIYAESDKDVGWKSKLKIGKGDLEVLKQYLDTTENPRDIADAFVDRFEKAGIPHSDKRRNRTDKYFKELSSEQNINQNEPIQDVGKDIPMKDEKFPMERVQDIPEEKSMYETIKPYVPILRHFNEGGAVPMQKQMEMFEDGGLKDEGGSVDPVSGNDVPPGSTQEEVRDDIPAQLSEGEFVFPADVVRFIGLNNLMQMRQQAKMGLKQMEEMGQMGNSEEATMPDDLPFDINDLDMEDELEYNVGGFVPGTLEQQQYGISGMQKADAPTTGVAAVPQQAASSQYVQPIQAAVPTAPVYKPAEVPTFKGFVGENVPGVDFEYVEYKNEAGNIIKLRKSKTTGELLDPVPEGYTFVDPEATKVEEATVTPTTPQTTSVREEGGDGVDQDGAFGNVERMKQRTDLAKRMGFTEFQSPMAGLVGAIMGTSGAGDKGTITGTGYVLDGEGGMYDPITGYKVNTGLVSAIKQDFSLLGKSPMETDIVKRAEAQKTEVGRNVYNKASEMKVIDKYDALIQEARDKGDSESANTAETIKETMRKEAIKGNIDLRTGMVLNPAEYNRPEKTGDTTPQKEEISIQEQQRQLGLSPGAMGGRVEETNSGDEPDYSGSGVEDRGAGFGGGDFETGLSHATGGLISKPKPKAKKKMKQGGLASKK